jgi:flap endonuclease-1
MGVNLGNLLQAEQIDLEQLSGKKVGIDAFNHAYQYLSTIRDWKTGESLKDYKGNITSHLSGFFYRTSKLMQAGMKICYVWDGPSPEFKRKTQEARAFIKEEAKKKHKEALEKKDYDKARLYAQQTAHLNEDMIKEAIDLLKAMGIPSIQAPSEGEAQIAFMNKEGVINYAVSQDFDSLLFGAPKLIRNITLSGKRKLPYGGGYTFVYPELLELKKNLKALGIDREKLILIALFCGTDYNDGVKGIGPKKALDIVKGKTKKEIFNEFGFDEKIFNFFMKPKTKDVTLKFGDLDEEKIKKILIDQHDFSEDRVNKVISDIKAARRKGAQSRLSKFI